MNDGSAVHLVLHKREPWQLVVLAEVDK